MLATVLSLLLLLLMFTFSKVLAMSAGAGSSENPIFLSSSDEGESDSEAATSDGDDESVASSLDLNDWGRLAPDAQAHYSDASPFTFGAASTAPPSVGAASTAPPFVAASTASHSVGAASTAPPSVGARDSVHAGPQSHGWSSASGRPKRSPAAMGNSSRKMLDQTNVDSSMSTSKATSGKQPATKRPRKGSEQQQAAAEENKIHIGDAHQAVVPSWDTSQQAGSSQAHSRPEPMRMNPFDARSGEPRIPTDNVRRTNASRSWITDARHGSHDQYAPEGLYSMDHEGGEDQDIPPHEDDSDDDDYTP